MMEDIWVQRSLLDAVRSVNAQMAEFELGREDAKWSTTRTTRHPGPVRASSRAAPGRSSWRCGEGQPAGADGQADEPHRPAATDGAEQHHEAQGVAGAGQRRQAARASSRSSSRSAASSCPARGRRRPSRTRTARTRRRCRPTSSRWPPCPTRSHRLPTSSPPAGTCEIVKVEQVFDTRTVPVRRIEAMATREAGQPVVCLVLAAPEVPGPSRTRRPRRPPRRGPTAGGRPPCPGRRRRSPVPSDGWPRQVGTTRRRPGAAGSVGPSSTGNRKRYVEVNAEVRRMPVGIVVVVDQAYLQDVLLAFANSPLRFQITQVTWNRFRGRLERQQRRAAAYPENHRQQGGCLHRPGELRRRPAWSRRQLRDPDDGVRPGYRQHGPPGTRRVGASGIRQPQRHRAPPGGIGLPVPAPFGMYGGGASRPSPRVSSPPG